MTRMTKLAAAFGLMLLASPAMGQDAKQPDRWLGGLSRNQYHGCWLIDLTIWPRQTGPEIWQCVRLHRSLVTGTTGAVGDWTNCFTASVLTYKNWHGTMPHDENIDKNFAIGCSQLIHNTDEAEATAEAERVVAAGRAPSSPPIAAAPSPEPWTPQATQCLQSDGRGNVVACQ
jgi:hypothetical protein